MAEENKILISIEIENSELIKAAAITDIALKKIKASQKELSKQIEDAKAPEKATRIGQAQLIQKLTEEYKKNEIALGALSHTSRGQTLELKNLGKQVATTEGTYENISAQLSIATIKWKKLTKDQQENTIEGRKLSSQITEQTDKLKEQDSVRGIFVRNVGNYISGLQKENQVIVQNNEVLEIRKNRIQGLSKISPEQRDELNGITNQLAQNSTALQSNADKIQEHIHSIEGMTVAGEGQRTQIGFTINSIKTYANTIDGATQEIKDLEASMKGMDLGSGEFKKSADRVKALKLNVAQARGAVDEFGEREPKNLTKKAFADTADAAAGVTGAIQLVTLAFGNNETAAAAQATVLKLMAIQQAIVNVAKGAGAILDLASAVRTKALIAWQYIYTAAIGTTTGAAKAMRIALISTGLGALVVGIGLLVGYLMTLKKETKELTKEQKELADSIKAIREEETKELAQAVLVFSQLKQTNAGSKERKKLIDEVNKTYGTTLSNLSNEAAFLNAVALAEGSVIKQIQNKIFARLKEKDAEAEIIKLMKLKEKLSQQEILSIGVLETDYSKLTETEVLAAKASEVFGAKFIENKSVQLKMYLDQLEIVDRISMELAKLQGIVTPVITPKTPKTIPKEIKESIEEISKIVDDDAQKSFDRKVIIANKEAALRKQIVEETITDAKQKAFALLEIELDTSQQMLSIAKDRAMIDRFISAEEQDRIDEADLELRKIIDTIKKLKEVKEDVVNTDGVFSPKEIAAMNEAVLVLGQVGNAVKLLSDIINADAQNRLTLLDQHAAKEENNIKNSTLSETQKQKKISALNKKTALEKYDIELETFRASKAINIINAIIGAAVSVIQGFAQLGPIGGAIAAIPTAIATGIQIGIIASQPEPAPPLFAKGGHTGTGIGNIDSTGKKVAGVVHANEWVSPEWMNTHPTYGQHINYLEGVRSRGFVDGGFTTRQMASPINSTIAEEKMIRQLIIEATNRPTVVRVTDINRVNNEVNKTKVISTLR